MSRITKIWSEENKRKLIRELWLIIIGWQKELGFEDADRMEKIGEIEESGHEVVDELNRFIKETGYVNAHAGLTSSDIVDNVRLIQISESVEVIKELFPPLISKIRNFADSANITCAGYTHWKLASYTSMKGRFYTLSEPLYKLLINKPFIRQKRLGGATGTASALRILLGDNAERFIRRRFKDLDDPYEYTLQSTYFLSELENAQWLDRIAAQIHKIAQDVRFLCSTGELNIKKDKEYKGSSAMANKVNPIEAERICSLARMQPNFTRTVWDNMALNGMERTLDNSANMKVVLPQMFENICTILRETEILVGKLEVNEEVIKEKLDNEVVTIEDEMAIRIKNGESRYEVYNELHLINNK